MKTYILSQLSKLKKVSSSLDEKTEVEKILCGKPWHIFNDGDVCETYLFEPNGKLRIILGGKVTNAQWEYVEALKCVQLSLKDQQYMLQLSFFDQTLLAMKLYSGNEYCIMIEESRYADSQLKTLNDVQQYFAAIAAKQEKQLQEQKQLEILQILKEKKLEEERIRAQKRKEEEAEKERQHQIELNRIKEEISSAWLNSDECKKFRKKHKVRLWRYSSCACMSLFILFVAVSVAEIVAFFYSLGCGAYELSVQIAIFANPFVTYVLCECLWEINGTKLRSNYNRSYTQFVEKYLHSFKYSLTSTEVDDIVKHCPDLTK